MKLLRHLLASAVCVAVLASTTASEQTASVNLRGLEENYDQADLYPGPEEPQDENEIDVADDEEDEVEEPLLVDDEELQTQDPLADDDNLDDESELYPAVYGEDAEDTEEDNTSFEPDQVDSVRHLRSLADSTLAVQIRFASPAPPEEEVTPPSLDTDGAIPALRGPEKDVTL